MTLPMSPERISRPSRLLALAAAALILAPASLLAQDSPTARQIVDRHVEASGGRSALDRAGESMAEGTLTIPGAGITGRLVTRNAPNRMYMEFQVPGLGSIQSGFDGTTAWSSDPMQGPRILTGPEREAIVDGTRAGASARDTSAIQSMEATGRDTVDGVECWKVAVTWKSGRESTDCYSIETGLLHATTAVNESAMGTQEVLVLMKEYKRFDEVLVPTRMENHIGPQQMVMTIDSMQFGNVPADAFEPPPEIKALIGG